MERKKLVLLDAYALIFRAYYALIRTPRYTSQKLNTSAIFGFVNTLQDLLKRENPSHIAICFDPKGGTFRHEVYPEYKAGREETPEDIRKAVPYIKQIAEAYNIAVIEQPGYEADDVIGTLSVLARQRGYLTYMVTADKDFGQLVNQDVMIYKPHTGGYDIMGVKEVCDKFGIERTEQVIDILALMGDKVDNIPGCPGVGEVTAGKLVREFGSVEGLIEHTDQLKGALKKKVEENVEQIKFSKMLATIKVDVPIEFDEDALSRRAIDAEALRKVFTELEFRTFITRIIDQNEGNVGLEGVQPAAAAPAEVPQKPKPAPKSKSGQMSLFGDDDEEDEPAVATITTPAAAPAPKVMAALAKSVVADSLPLISDCAAKAMRCDAVGMEIIADGDESMTAKMVGVGVAMPDGEAFYVVDSTEGAVLKHLQTVPDGLRCVSENPAYAPYIIPAASVLKIYRVVGFVRALVAK